MRNKSIAIAMSMIMVFSVLNTNTTAFAENGEALDNNKSLTGLLENVYKLEKYENLEEFSGSMYEGHINASNIIADAAFLGTNTEYNQAISQLKVDKENNGTKGEINTSVFLGENETDAQELIFKTNVDFVGNVLEQPINVVFVMDQSGSMNMESLMATRVNNTSPCMNPNHYYRVKVKIGETTYYYMLNPVESNITATWISGTTNGLIEDYIENTESTVAPGSVTMIAFDSSYAPQDNHFSINDISTKGTVQKLFELDDANLTTLFTKQDTVVKSYGSVEEYYSPAYITKDENGNSLQDTEEYINYLEEKDFCYDRMLVSKILFKDLSNIVLEGDGNKIGYVQFAKTIRNSSSLITIPFDSNFTNIVGYPQTNYKLALNTAKDILEDDVPSIDPNKLDPKNFIIFISDGEPYGEPLSSATVDEDFMTSFLSSTDAIVYFAGIDLDGKAFDTWSKVIATTGDEIETGDTGDTELEHLAENGEDLEDLIGIRDYLEKVINSASTINAKIDPMFSLLIDENHPLEITYKSENMTTPQTVSYTSLEKALEEGLLYNEKTGDLQWYVSQREVVEARLSFYQQLNVDLINWTKIQAGETQEANVMKTASVEFIDINGFVKNITDTNDTSVKLNGNSEIRIKNETSTQTNINVNQEINYSITVTNTGNVDAKNLIVQQEIPNYTEYISHSVIDELLASGVYNSNANEILFTIPVLKANESIVLNYTAVAKEYNVTIESSAKLGVLGNEKTLNADGTPILSAITIIHKTGQMPDTNPNPATPAPTSTLAPTAYPSLPIIVTTPQPTTQATQSPKPSESPFLEEEGVEIPKTDEDEYVDIGKVEVDGNILEEGDYTIDENGKIQISQEYLNTLEEGEHTLTITTSDGQEYVSNISSEVGIPLSPFALVEKGGAAWSLFDLIVTILSVILMFLYMIMKNKEIDDEDEDNTNEIKNKRKSAGLILIVLAAFNVILFIITQNLTLPMIIFDKWSILFALIFIIQIITFCFSKKKVEEEPMEDKIYY